MAAGTKWRIIYFSTTPSIWVSNERATQVEYCQQPQRGPTGPRPAWAAGLFERVTVALVHKWPTTKHNYFCQEESGTPLPLLTQGGVT